MDRKKLELELNKPTHLKLLYDDCIIGESQYGRYYLYAVSTVEGNEHSYFATADVHESLKNLNRGAEVEIMKTAKQTGKKLVTSIDVKVISDGSAPEHPQSESGSNDTYFNLMLKSFEEALKIQEQFNGMVKIDQVAISLFIARTKVGGLS